MIQASYSELLKNPKWQKKRLEILARDEWKCRYCGVNDTTLHVHHLFYSPNKAPWEISDGFLVALCEHCHKPGPCEGNSSCDTCSSFNKDCVGPGNPHEDIVSAIGNLLNVIFAGKDDMEVGRAVKLLRVVI